MYLKKFGLIFLFLFLSACVCSSPPNLGENKIGLYRYQQSGQYDHDVSAKIQEAENYITWRSGHVKNPAVVLDIDETSISNWPELRANDLTFILPGECKNLPQGPCGIKAWQKLEKARAFPASLHLYNAAKEHGITVFFLTGRDETVRKATEENLKKEGYSDWKKLIMRPAGSKTLLAQDYKAPQRAIIEKSGYKIIANIGDQPSDLAGGYAEKSFLVPNPFYRIP